MISHLSDQPFVTEISVCDEQVSDSSLAVGSNMASKWRKLKFVSLAFSKPNRNAQTPEAQAFPVSLFTSIWIVPCYLYHFIVAQYIFSYFLNSVLYYIALSSIRVLRRYFSLFAKILSMTQGSRIYSDSTDSSVRIASLKSCEFVEPCSILHIGLNFFFYPNDMHKLFFITKYKVDMG